MNRRGIYLDNNATSLPDPRVMETVLKVSRDAYGNPGSRHAAGRRSRQVLEDSREKIAELLLASPDELIFTSGGTEANNLAISGARLRGDGSVAALAGEHPAVAEAIDMLVDRGYARQVIPLDSQGRMIDPAALSWGELRLVACLLANNETGVIQDVTHLSKIAADAGAWLHLDAVQAVGKIPVRFKELNAASLAFAAHKFNGPRGVGGLLVRRGLHLVSKQVGGHQEFGKRAGTESVALIAGMAHALEIAVTDMDSRFSHQKSLRDRLQAALIAECSPAVVNGGEASRLPNTLNIAFPGVDGEALLVALDLEGVYASLGSACASGSVEPSPVLVAMGCSREVLVSSLRLSIGVETSIHDIDSAAGIICSVVKRLRSNAATAAS